jgi:hypothetical protein
VQGEPLMSTPLILQIQQAAMDRNAPLTDALTKAKVACAKLGLTKFGEWVDRELHGYMDMPVEDLPPYRRLRGVPEGFNPYQGWSAITFWTGEQEAGWGDAPIGISVPSIEASLSPARPVGSFYFPYPAEVKRDLLKSLQRANDVRIRLEVPQVVGLLQHVRSILLDWTLGMEKQGVLGENILFSPLERANAAGPTSEAIHSVYNIENVGTLFQSADRSIIQGSVHSTLGLMQQADQLVGQIERLLPASDLPAEVRDEATRAIADVREATASKDEGRLRKGLAYLGQAFADAGDHVIRVAVDQMVAKMLGQ